MFGQLPDNMAMEEKIRVSKLLSELGLCSRREADSYIEQGLVTVDGEVVNELGSRAFRSQKIELQSGAKAQQASRITVILNKPVGFISHYDDEQEYQPAASLILIGASHKLPNKVTPWRTSMTKIVEEAPCSVHIVRT